MVINRLKDLFRGDQQRGHLPNGHFKVHLRELEQSAPRISHYFRLFSSTASTDLLKNRGMRTLDPRLVGVDPPRLAGPAC
jgi:hypothetical protein